MKNTKTINEMNAGELKQIIRTGTSEQALAAHRRLYAMSDAEVVSGGGQHEAQRHDNGYSPFDSSPFDEAE